jgi:hypothetical protein
VCAWVDIVFGSGEGDGGLVQSGLRLRTTEPFVYRGGEGEHDARNVVWRDDRWRLRGRLVEDQSRVRIGLLAESILGAVAASPTPSPPELTERFRVILMLSTFISIHT